MLEALRRHLHFIMVTAVLTIVMTFPTIVYVFKPDVFWLPEKQSLPAGAYTAKLIVYDFETQVTQGGILTGTNERFERELELATIEV